MFDESKYERCKSEYFDRKHEMPKDELKEDEPKEEIEREEE